MERLSNLIQLNPPKPNLTPRPLQNLAVATVLTKREFTRAMQVMFLNMPNLPMQSDGTLDVWHELLKDLSAEQLEKGVLKFSKDHLDVYPNTNIVAHIRKYALESEPKARLSADEAWEAARLEVGRVISTKTPPQLQDPRVRLAAETLSWRYIFENLDRPETKEQFVEYYENQLARDNVHAITRAREEK